MNNEKLRATIRNIVNTWHWNRNEQVVELLNRCYVALGEQASVPDDEAVMAKARELFGWAYGLGGFSDAVRDLVAFAHPASASSAGGESMKDLPNKLHIKATMIELGERIAWGSETALMHEAADKIEALGAELATLREGQEPVATVTIQHFRQDPRMENLHFQLQAELPQGTHKLYASPVAQEPDIEQIMAKAKELFGWSAGLGGFDDAVRELVAFTAGHRFAQPAPAAPAADAGLVEALEQITRMTYDEWTNGAVASRIAEEALAAYREAQEKK